METYTAAEEAGLLRLKPRVRVTTTPTEGERERGHTDRSNSHGVDRKQGSRVKGS